MAIRPVPDFEKQIALAGFSRTSLAKAAKVAPATVHGIVHPQWQPQRKSYTVRPRTAWSLAKAYARVSGVSEDEAFNRLFTQENFVTP